ncbi:MAG TPA: LysM domain-containing protein [Anaerolineales bacterium]|nr:LysM domain-containing protein [Anaerolineales bacterium]
MPENEPKAADVIHAYRRRRERMVPLFLGGLAVVLTVVGLLLVVIWLTGDRGTALPAFLASDTPTLTDTTTPAPPTLTPTVTDTPLPSETPTPEGPKTYIVEPGDTLSSIADQFDVDILLLISVNNISDPSAINAGQELIIPQAGAVLPTTTALPQTLVPGSRIEYVVQPGDSLESIASEFNSTAEKIAELNDIKVTDVLFVGKVLIVPVNIVTRTPTSTVNPETPTATTIP